MFRLERFRDIGLFIAIRCSRKRAFLPPVSSLALVLARENQSCFSNARHHSTALRLQPWYQLELVHELDVFRPRIDASTNPTKSFHPTGNARSATVSRRLIRLFLDLGVTSCPRIGLALACPAIWCSSQTRAIPLLLPRRVTLLGVVVRITTRHGGGKRLRR